MNNAPERIWAFQPTIFDEHDVWQKYPHELATEYIRADLHAALQAERDALKVERDDAMALFHAADKQMRANKAERDAAVARAEAAEAAVVRAWERCRKDAIQVVLNKADANHLSPCGGAYLNAASAIRALTPPADLGKGVTK